MAFLVILLVLLVPILIGVAVTMSFAFKLAAGAFLKIANRWHRFAAQVAFLFFAVVVSLPLSWWLARDLPDFRTLGDGGIGMLQNFLATVVLYLFVPGTILVGLAVALRQLFGPGPITKKPPRFPSGIPTRHDPFE